MHGVCLLFCVLLPCAAIAIGGCRRSNVTSRISERKTTRNAETISSATSAPETWDLEAPASVAAELARLHGNGDLGAELFAHYCAVCHDAEGRGDGIYYVDNLDAMPADLTDKMSSESWTGEHIETVVREGSGRVGKSPLCPPWGSVFSDNQVSAVVAYVQQLPDRPAEE